MGRTAHFGPEFFAFLRGLAKHNTREWFVGHKAEFEEHVKGPMQAFLEDVAGRMGKVSPRVKVGAMQRMNRDTRFSKDKSPYRRCVSAMMMVEGAGERALGYHVSLVPGESKAYVGLWEPDGATLEKVRTRIMVKPDEWKKAVGGAFGKSYVFEGESLKRPPKVCGCAVEEGHPLIDDLKRKSHAAAVPFSDKDVCSAAFLDEYMKTVQAGAPLMEFVCKAVGVKW